MVTVFFSPEQGKLKLKGTDLSREGKDLKINYGVILDGRNELPEEAGEEGTITMFERHVDR